MKPLDRGLLSVMGLAISERIVKNHGGAIAVKSSPDQGTTFTIRLPLHRNSKAKDFTASAHGADSRSADRSLSEG